jgi:hypothetical protein
MSVPGAFTSAIACIVRTPKVSMPSAVVIDFERAFGESVKRRFMEFVLRDLIKDKETR